MNEFPPRPAQVEAISLLVEAFSTVVEGDAAVYVSSPLTTGPRAFEWHRQHAPETPTFVSEVIEPNRRDAAAFVRTVRAKTSNPVIDPTAMKDLEGWEQSDYRYFWGRVIQDYCYEVIFREGWQYSSGCSYEFLVAVKKGIPMFTERLQPLVVAEGIELLGRAAVETEEQRASAAFLAAVRHELLKHQVVWRR